jgi:hypothetical protein
VTEVTATTAAGLFVFGAGHDVLSAWTIMAVTSLKIRLKHPNDVLDFIGESVQHQVLHPTVADEYAHDAASVHIRLIGLRVGEGPPCDQCASVNRTREDLDRPAGNFLNGIHGDLFGNDVQGPMLVDHVQIVEQPEMVWCRIPRPSVIRLQPLDHCLLTGWKISYAPASVTSVGVPSLEDREQHRSFDVGIERFAERGDVQLVDEVVKGGAEIKQNITDDERQAGARRARCT